MTIEDVAKQYKLRTAKIGDEVIIPAKFGHIFMWSDKDGDTLGAFYSTGRTDETAKGWNQRRKEWLAAGANHSQNGETEGVVTFPVGRKDLVKLSIKLLKVYRKRTVSLETKAKMVSNLAKARSLKKAG